MLWSGHFRGSRAIQFQKLSTSSDAPDSPPYIYFELTIVSPKIQPRILKYERIQSLLTASYGFVSTTMPYQYLSLICCARDQLIWQTHCFWLVYVSLLVAVDVKTSQRSCVALFPSLQTMHGYSICENNTKLYLQCHEGISRIFKTVTQNFFRPPIVRCRLTIVAFICSYT